MSQITIANVTFGYEGNYDNVFEDVTINMDTDWRIGLVGRNGKGKTTLLRLLSGVERPHLGTIIMPVQCDYFPFHIEDEEKSASESLGELNAGLEDWMLLRELDKLEVEPEKLYQSFGSLSGGEKTKILLAALFLREGRFFLIDEPTNHLDMQSRRLVRDYLKSKKGFILISHDRDFLDGCIDHVIAINRSSIQVRKGSFSAWMQDKAARDSWEMKENEKLKKDIARLNQASRRTAVWADKTEATKTGTRNSGLRPDRGFIGHKSAKMMSKAKTTQDRMNDAIEEKSKLLHDVEKTETLSIPVLRHTKNRIVLMRDFALQYAGADVCEPLTLELKHGQVLALIGKNGSGKSSVLRCIAGEAVSYSGTLEMPGGLIVSYVSQHPGNLEGGLERFAEESGADLTLLLTIMRKMDFSRAQFEKNISSFSEGQKKKLLIARSLCTPAHLYIWDEPLNYIDILSRIQIEQIITSCRPTMIISEHDAAFVNAVSTSQIQVNRAACNFG